MPDFIHHDGRIWIKGELIRLDAFLELEPDYTLPAPAIGRRDRILTDGKRSWLDKDFSPAPYVARLAEYRARSAELDVIPDPDLPTAKRRAMALVDGDAEQVRARWITPGSGQAMVYEAKRHEVLAWEAAATKVLPDYPFMRRRAARLNAVAVGDVTEAQMQAIATEWRSRLDAFTAAGLDIEDTREASKEAIASALDHGAIRAILSAISWPEPT